MARIRYLKPEAAADTKLAECSRDARLLYRDLWCHMDKGGLTEDDPRLIKRNVFPYDDDLTAERVHSLISELVRVGRLVRLTWEGKPLLYCPTLTLHQNFHRDERPKYEIPVEVLLAACEQKPDALPAPVKHDASTVLTPSKHPANTTGNGERVTGNGERRTENCERVTANAGQHPAGTRPPSQSDSIKNQKLLGEINEASEVYRETLRHFRQGRTLLESERLAIGRAIQINGVKAVKLALLGARYEPKTEGKFDPGDWVDLNRYLDPKNFKRFLGYGVKHSPPAAEATA